MIVSVRESLFWQNICKNGLTGGGTAESPQLFVPGGRRVVGFLFIQPLILLSSLMEEIGNG
jgi:hypothetical protein